jgi:hypothetical protein
MITQKTPAPTPTEVDALCLRFDQAKIVADDAAEKLSTAKGELLVIVQNYGYMPADASKTKRLEGVIYVADAITSSTFKIIEALVAKLQSELSRLGKPKIFGEIFETEVKHTLKKNAAQTLKLAIGGFPESIQSRLLALYGSCLDVNTKTPALSVELVAALREKEAAAEAKAAKKAERDAKKAAKKGGAK